MNITAVRDDGALLVTGGGDAAVIISQDGTWVTTRGAALARGQWGDPGAGDVVPIELRDKIRDKLAQYDAELDHMLSLTAAFDPHEARDTHGRWARTPGSKLRRVRTKLVEGTFMPIGDVDAEKLQDPDWTPAQRRAITDYTSGDHYENINSYLRGETVDINPDSRRVLDDLMSALRPLPQNIRVYRSVGTDAFIPREREGASNWDAIEQLNLEGKIIRDGAFMSTVVRRDTLNEGNYPDAIMMTIEVPAGTRAAYAGDLSHTPDDYEMILGPDMCHRVRRVRRVSTFRIDMTLRVVPCE